MNKRELENLEKNSIYSLKVCDELKETVINSYLNNLNKVIKSNLKKKNLLVLVVEMRE